MRIVVFVALLRRVLLRAGSADPVRGAGRSPVVRFGGFGDNRTLSLAVVTGRRAEPPAHFLLRPGDNVRAAVDAFAPHGESRAHAASALACAGHSSPSRVHCSVARARAARARGANARCRKVRCIEGLRLLRMLGGGREDS